MHKNKYFKWLAGMLIVPASLLLIYSSFLYYKSVTVQADVASSYAGCVSGRFHHDHPDRGTKRG